MFSEREGQNHKGSLNFRIGEALSLIRSLQRIYCKKPLTLVPLDYENCHAELFWHTLFSQFSSGSGSKIIELNVICDLGLILRISSHRENREIKFDGFTDVLTVDFSSVTV